jgi:Flp pilus assembly protein TadD
VALYFSRTPPVRVPVTAMMVSKQIDIPAGDANYVVTDRYELPVAAELIGLFPHAHYLGKEMLVTATRPGASAPTTLLHIKHWSFHWQQDYRYVSPVSLPPGTVIDLRFTYDNSTGNPDNPHHPPTRVRVGSQSTDEMANLGLQFLTASPADTTTLLASVFRRDVSANIAAGEAGVRETPDSVAQRVHLGSSYLQAGRFVDAIPHLEAAVRLDPRHAIAESLLGGAYLSLGRVAEALPHFQKSARLAPDDERAHLNLGDALEKTGRRGDAMAAYRRAIALNGESFEAHVKLTTLLVSAGNLSAALTHLRRIVAIRPNSADAYSDLGAVLADLGQRDEALRHLRRALELDPTHTQAREHLARLTRGRPDEGPRLLSC